jgi:hypothetical protein
MDQHLTTGRTEATSVSTSMDGVFSIADELQFHSKDRQGEGIN